MTDYNELVRCGECKFWSETEKWFGRCLKSGFKTPKDFLGEDGERKDQGMTDYTKLVKALRCCIGDDECEKCPRYEQHEEDGGCIYKLNDDAAAAIEALQAEVDALVHDNERYIQFNTDLLNTKEVSKDEMDEILEYLRNAPVGPIGPIEPMRIELLPKQGEWKEIEDYDGDFHYQCSVCGEEWYFIDGTPADNNANYCPRCGAKMEVHGGE